MLCLGLLCGHLSPFDSQNIEVSFEHTWEMKKKEVVSFYTAVQWFGCLSMWEMGIISSPQLLSCLNSLLKRCLPLDEKSTVLVGLTVPMPTIHSGQ